MKSIGFVLILLISLFSSLSAFELRLNSGMQNKEEYVVLHISHEEPFECQILKDNKYEDYVKCGFDKVPVVTLEDKNTTYFNIDFDISPKDNRFDVTVVPNFRFHLRPNYIDLKNTIELLPSKETKFEHWVLIGYKNNPPFVDYKKFEGINFPVIFPDVKRPYVGALDFNGKPIVYSKSNDLNTYVEIKKEFMRKGYDKVVTLADNALKRFKNTMFTKEFVLYKLKAMDKMYEIHGESEILEGNDIVDIAHKWIKSFPSDDNLPEVLLILSRAYLKLGYRNDANYYFDVLISEHPNSKYARLGILYYADELYKGKAAQKKKAAQLYRDVYVSATDLDVASQSAVRLANVAINKGDLKEAKEYYDKVLALNSQFVLEDLEAAYRLATDLASKKLYELSANIGERILKQSTKTNIYYEDLLKDVGLWYDQAELYEKAYQFYKDYLASYQFGRYEELVQRNLDKLFFQLEETNSSKQLEHYDYVLQNYKDKEIYNRAVEEKANVLYSQNKLEQADALRDELMDENASAIAIFQKISSSLLQSYLQKDECTLASNLYTSRVIDIPKEQDMKIFDCLVRTSKYDKAKSVLERNIENDDLLQKAQWYAKGVQLFAKNSQGDDAIKLYNDLLKFAKKAQFKTDFLLYDLFAMQQQKGDLEKMVQIAQQIAQSFPDAFENVEVFVPLANTLQKNTNDTGAIEFYEKAYVLQNRLKRYPYSPDLELAYIESLKKLGQAQKAYDVASSLKEKKFEPVAMSRILFVLGDLALKTGNKQEALEVFEQCTSLDVQSSWKNLCENGKSLAK